MVSVSTISGAVPTYKGGEHSVSTEVARDSGSIATTSARLTAKSNEFNYVDGVLGSFAGAAESGLLQVLEDAGDTNTILFEFFVHGTTFIQLAKPIRQPLVGQNVGADLAAGAGVTKVAIFGHTGQ